jgi:S-adenosylmethionine:tRNA ribosyltransferase-isomerase
LYWTGVKLLKKHEQPLHIYQWETYSYAKEVTVNTSLKAVIEFLEHEDSDVLYGSTQLMIVPGYSFSMAKGLVTNFHQPRSTLLLLVAAFTGDEEWKSIYKYAINHDFRFLSYGDSSLLLPYAAG